MAFLARERTSAQYTVTLKDDTGAAIAKASVSSFKVTMFCLDDDAQTVINLRDAQDVYNAGAWDKGVTMHATSGLVTFAMAAADNPIVGLTPNINVRYERHRLIFDVTLSNGTRLVHVDELLVENAEKVTS
jgi:hypothetical protein